MSLTSDQRRLVEDFRTWIEGKVTVRLGNIEPERHDGADASILTTRWLIEPHFWHEITVRPTLPQVRVAILTDDRWRSRDFREMIEAGGYTLQEFVAMACASVGLEWADPPVEHYREKGEWFRFATPIDLRSLDQLADADFRDRFQRLSAGYDRVLQGTAAE
jgi:hypothetical protein